MTRAIGKAPVTAAMLMVVAAALFALMGVCVKLASRHYAPGEIVFYRSVVSVLFILGMVKMRGGSLITTTPVLHFWRSSFGVASLCVWFYTIGKMPLGTAMTLNYTSSLWLALFIMGWAAWRGAARSDPRVVAALLIGFVGVALVLRPSLEAHQVLPAALGLLSGMFAAVGYMMVAALGRAGEPEYRVVYYFALGGVIVGGLTMLATGVTQHTTEGLALLMLNGVLATLAQMLLTRAYAVGNALSNAALLYLGIAFAFVLGIWFFDEQPTLLGACGVMLIAVAGLTATRLRTPVPVVSAAAPVPQNGLSQAISHQR